MLIVCPSCATSYDVEPASLQPNGRQVRCVRCRTVWRAGPSQAKRLAASAEALAPGRAPATTPIERAHAMGAVLAERAPEPAGGRRLMDSGLDDQPPDGRAFETPDEGAGYDVQADWTADIDSESAEMADGVAAEAPPLAPVDLDAGRPPLDIDHGATPIGALHEDIETVAARLARRRVKQRTTWPLSSLQTVIMVLVVVDSILVGWRNDVVRVLPQTASFYSLMGLAVNLRGLAFDAVTTSTEAHEGVPILVVQGNIINDTGTVVGVPRLKLAVRNAAKQEIYSWTAAVPRATLSPGQAVAFRTRLASPPPDSHDVLVRFITRRDIVADTR